MQEGAVRQLATALTFAQEDLSCKEQYFISPTAFLAACRKVPHAPAVALQSSGSAPPKGQGKKRSGDQKPGGPAVAKQKSKGGGKSGTKAQRHWKTPDGRIICRFVNLPQGCTKGSKCDFIHICNICLSPDHVAGSSDCPGR